MDAACFASQENKFQNSTVASLLVTLWRLKKHAGHMRVQHSILLCCTLERNLYICCQRLKFLCSLPLCYSFCLSEYLVVCYTGTGFVALLNVSVFFTHSPFAFLLCVMPATMSALSVVIIIVCLVLSFLLIPSLASAVLALDVPVIVCQHSTKEAH